MTCEFPARDAFRATLGWKLRKGKEATIEEALSQIERLSEETGLTKATVDNIIWSFCADGYGEVCTATPHC